MDDGSKRMLLFLLVVLLVTFALIYGLASAISEQT